MAAYMSRKSLLDLVTFLERNYPRDVVMPVRKGEKHPMFAHQNGTWTWASWHRFARDNQRTLKDYDYCVLLRDLCVVDVDNQGLVEELLAQFPCLNAVPCTATAKGAHFWCVRPDEAETLGYFDGAGQRQQGVDFKSMCSTGTSGIVMVPPSTNKTWRRWLDRGLTTMPLELLDAVAVPRHVATDMTLIFEDDDADVYAPLSVRGSRCMSCMTYFEPFLSGEMDDRVVPVPCKRSVFEQLVRVLDHGELGPEPSRAQLRAMQSALDKLGGSDELQRRLSSGVPRMQLDWAEVDGDSWAASQEERRWLREQGGADDSLLVSVDRALAQQVTYAPLKQDERWLFKGGPKQPLQQGDYVLHEDPVAVLLQAMEVLCPVLPELLRRFPGQLVLAGGAVLGCCSWSTAAGSDWDLFVVGADEAQADAMVEEAERLLGPNKVIRTSRAVTFMAGCETAPVTVQVVRRLYANPSQVICGFDFAPCRVAAWMDPSTRELTIKALPSWVAAMRRLAFPVELERWSQTTAARVLKYVSKGLDVYVPGLRRAAVKPFDAAMGLSQDSSLSRLLWVEHDVLRARIKTGKCCRLTAEEVRHYTNKCCTSDYDTVAKLRGTIWYILRAALRKGRAFLGRVNKQQSTAQAARSWPVFDAQKKNAGVFQPASPRLWGALCQKKLAELLDVGAAGDDNVV